MRAARVAVQAADPITRLALVSYFARRAQLALTPNGSDADIVIAAMENPDEEALSRLERKAGPESLFILIVDGTWNLDLHRAVAAGLRAVLFRAEFTWERFDEAIRQVRAGNADLPTVIQGRLVDQVKRTNREVLAPRGLTSGGLTAREVDVLRMVADGCELQEIGAKLGYSERTVKNALYGVIKRHGLRNRAHAVSYAIRCGQI